MGDERAQGHPTPTTCPIHHTFPPFPPPEGAFSPKKWTLPFLEYNLFSLLFHPIPLTSTAAQRDSLVIFLAQFLCLHTLLANWEVSTPEAPSPWDQQRWPWTTHSPTGQLKQFLTHKNNVPELFDVFLASFKALQQLGTRWEARTVGQDPKSIESIGAFPWIGFGSGLLWPGCHPCTAQSSSPELVLGLYYGFLHISYMSFTESHPTSILGNEDLWGGEKTCVIINLSLKCAVQRMEMRRIILHFIVLWAMILFIAAIWIEIVPEREKGSSVPALDNRSGFPSTIWGFLE